MFIVINKLKVLIEVMFEVWKIFCVYDKILYEEDKVFFNC